MSHNDIDIVESLIQMGLSEREAKVYRVLLGIEEITASAIPKFADIPRTKVYEVLTSLEKKGFCRENTQLGGSGPQTFSAVSPKLALEALMRPERERVKRLEEISEQLREEMQPLYNNSATRLGDYEFIQILKGREEIIQAYNTFRRNATGEILEMSKGDYAMSDEEASEEADANARLISNGVTLSAIYERKEIEKEGDSYFHRTNHKLGLRARMTDELPIKMSLFSGNIVMLPLSDPVMDVPNVTVLIIEHPSLYQALKVMYRVYWNSAQEITWNSAK